MVKNVQDWAGGIWTLAGVVHKKLQDAHTGLHIPPTGVVLLVAHNPGTILVISSCGKGTLGGVPPSPILWVGRSHARPDNRGIAVQSCVD